MKMKVKKKKLKDKNKNKIKNKIKTKTKKENNIYGFGDNENHQLGIFDEDIKKISIPKKIKSFKNLKIKEINCGFEHTIIKNGFFKK